MYRIAVLALENCVYSSVIGPYDIFCVANRIWQEQHGEASNFCQVSILLPETHAVRAFNGLAIHSSETIVHSKETFDIILVPALFGGVEKKGAFNSGVRCWLQKQYETGACICTVCAGAFLAAEAGLFAEKRATTHWALAGDFRKRYPEVTLQPEKMLIDEGDIISAGGVTAYLDISLYIVSRFGSGELASALSKILLIDSVRQAQQPYTSFSFLKNHDDREIVQTQNWMEENYLLPQITVGQLSRIAGLGERTFVRRFKKATGETPIMYLQQMRVEAARKMLTTTNDTFDQITDKTGYQDTSSFRRIFKEHTGMTPTAYRKKFRIVPD